MAETVTFDRRTIPADATEWMWRAPDGHSIRVIDWGQPPAGATPRGALLFMPGRGDAYEKYLESLEHWRLQGWQVSAADWRGQGGSGRLGSDGHTGHIADFAHWVGDLAAFWREWAGKHTGPRALVGHSMGGHLCLRAVMEQALEPAPDALVLSAPMLDVLPEHVPLFAKRGFARAMARIGDPSRPAWGASEKPLSLDRFRQNLLTHCDERYEDERFWRAQRPELHVGAGSWGWVASAMDSVIAMHQRGALESVELPVFIVATTSDKLVSPAAIKAALARLPQVQSLIFGDEARHEILRESDPVRLRALAAIDEFLKRTLT